MKEIILDLRIPDENRKRESIRTAKIVHKLNNAEPFSDEHIQLERELFKDMGENSRISTPIYVNIAQNIHIGKNVVIMPYFKCMSAGNVYIEDNTRIALNVSVITNNHDFYERDILTIKDVHICKNVWIGAGATILSGITIGENAIVGAGSVVTKDVEANTVVVGNPAKVIKRLEPEKFIKS